MANHARDEAALRLAILVQAINTLQGTRSEFVPRSKLAPYVTELGANSKIREPTDSVDTMFRRKPFDPER